MLLLIGLLSSSASPLPGFDDLALYQNVTTRFVGAQAFVSFSSASAHGPHGSSVSGHTAPAPEALCNCACFALPDLVYCQNTAKTTVGISTFAFGSVSGASSGWTGRALRYFADGSAGAVAGRFYTSFLEAAVLPEGPGGPIYFEVAYTADTTASSASGLRGDQPTRSAEVVRGYTGPVDCAAAPLCNTQCAGVAQYETWRQGCA